MSHVLSAFVCPERIARDMVDRIGIVSAVRLNQGLALVPLGDEVCEGYRPTVSPEAPEADLATDLDGFYLTEELEWLAATLSKEGPVAYVQTDYFGGIGSQGAIVWKDGRVVYGPERSWDVPVSPQHPINRALRFLRVEPRGHVDAFEAVGLDWYRETGDWERHADIRGSNCP